MRDLKMMNELGLGSGGRLDNFILVGEDEVINTELRFPDEFVRHKILDIIGDLYLLGYPIRGKVTARWTGHRDNIALLRDLLSSSLTIPGRGRRSVRSGRPPALAGRPVVVWLGYSDPRQRALEGPTPRCSSPTTWRRRGAEVEELLERTVVLLDPSLNPDGLARFAHWVACTAAAAGRRPATASTVEGWPSARTNHYWFDLNRDWLLLQHPESRARVATLQRWRPNVVADFHEMGTDSTFFFQPGVPSRQNPLTPERNLELTREIARFHADAFDRAGSLYYSEETFDDFYYGKGSTYPDVQGAVGILFEQASSRGIRAAQRPGGAHLRRSVANQLRASFSTLAGAAAKRTTCSPGSATSTARPCGRRRPDPVGGWIVGRPAATRRARHELVAILDAHGIRVHRLARDTSAGGATFAAGEAFVVPAAQRQARLAEALFERRTEFADETFYDVSAWTLPLAFGLPSGAGSTSAARASSRWRGRPR
jgi:hypothetical protein